MILTRFYVHDRKTRFLHMHHSSVVSIDLSYFRLLRVMGGIFLALLKFEWVRICHIAERDWWSAHHGSALWASMAAPANRLGRGHFRAYSPRRGVKGALRFAPPRIRAPLTPRRGKPLAQPVPPVVSPPVPTQISTEAFFF